MLARLIAHALDLDTKERRAHTRIVMILDQDTTIGCPWCGVDEPANHHHADDCTLLKRAGLYLPHRR